MKGMRKSCSKFVKKDIGLSEWINLLLYLRVTLRRDRSSMAITGEGLAMAGVGYDLHSLSIPKFGVTTTNQKRLRKKEMKRKLKEAQGQNDVS